MKYQAHEMNLKLEEFNECPGAKAMMEELVKRDVLKTWEIADGLGDLVNGPDTLVLRLREGISPTLKDGIVLGEVAVYTWADEFGMYTDNSKRPYVRFWWD